MVKYSLAENFIDSVENFCDKIAVEDRISGELKSLSYRDMGKSVRSCAYYMASLGIKKSDRVSIIMENRPEWPEIFFALAYIGAVAVPLDPQMSIKGMKNILSDSGAKFVFISRENVNIAESLKGEIHTIIFEGTKESVVPEDFKNSPVEPDDLMVLLYTSGTTDLPKGVMLTHKNLCANFCSLKKMKIYSVRDTILSVLPLYHSYSLMTALIAPIFSGSKIVYVASDWPERLVEYIKEVNATIFLGVPQIYHMMHARMMRKLEKQKGLVRLYVKIAMNLGLTKILVPSIKNAFGKRLRFFISGGAKLDSNVAGDFFKLGFKILEGYGLTETSPVASMSPIKRPNVGSIGKPVPDVEMKIVNKDTSGVGEIAIKGPNVMKGYYKDEVKTREVIKDGWFFSGDLGYMDKDGYFYITGRSKEMIVLSSGKNIYPEEIEKHYSATPYIKEMYVLGILKEKGGGKLEYLHAVVVPDLEFFKERGEMNVREVIRNVFDNLSKDLPGYKHIMGFSVTHEDLPRTVLGKLKRYEIEKKMKPIILDEKQEEKELTPQEEKLAGSDIAKRLIKCIKDILDIKSHVHLNDSIELDLGVDSLGRVELVLAVEKCFDVEFPQEMVSGEIFTVKDVILKVEELLNKKCQQSKGKEQKKKAVYWAEILKQPLPEEFQRKISLSLGWVDYCLTFLIKGAFNLFFRVFYRFRVEGTRNIPRKGPYVLCVNHTSFLDGFIVTAAVPFRTELELFFIGFRKYFVAPIVRNLVKRARIIPIDASQIVEAMQGSSFILKNNKALCIFPEGERSVDGSLKEFKKGIGIITWELDAMIVPVFIKGAFEAWPRTERFPRLCPISIRFGEPVSSKDLLREGLKLGIKDDYEAISSGIRARVTALNIA